MAQHAPSGGTQSFHTGGLCSGARIRSVAGARRSEPYGIARGHSATGLKVLASKR
jgi:hypothetical protein